MASIEVQSCDNFKIILPNHIVKKSSILQFYHDENYETNINQIASIFILNTKPCFKWCFELILFLSSFKNPKLWIKENLIPKTNYLLCFIEFCIYLDFYEWFKILSNDFSEYLSKSCIKIKNNDILYLSRITIN